MQTEISHAGLGTLKYNESLGWYEGAAATVSGKVALYLSVEVEAEVEKLMAEVATFMAFLGEFLARAKSFSADELLVLKNGEWRDESGAAISHQQFVDRLENESVTFYPAGDIEILFKDGGLFFGHVVLVAGNLQGEFSEASIAG